MLRSERKLHVEPRPDESLFNLKVAFTTQDRHHVDQHFGTAKCVLVYGVGKDNWSLIEAIEYPDSDERRHDKLPGRIQDLAELKCSAIYCNACGVSAIRKLLENDINPVKVHEGADIHDLICELQDKLKGTPTGWVNRAIKSINKPLNSDVSSEKRLAQMMEEDW
ncbi:NifB/NifX family molybdenum-iron cluster-binding protein [Vibrio hannami]|uniref:NifB/NifX family molybdenum-iron cluster-binding protein n=1 Tax=Vibrio hannami TaxID=2717094 RepID=UPI00240FF4A4|nr:NifB/NifX family molybdenum-iron cluster-binding protein [Vibrio hannami]MDG3085009.1 NifB/NifX family molybdenum-iron cluster-binding protein [Vibrio hannami]